MDNLEKPSSKGDANARCFLLDVSRMEYEDFLKAAEEAKQGAQCVKRSVGAVVVQGGEIVGRGSNVYRGSGSNCLGGGCPRGANGGSKAFPCIALHAEENAILEAGSEAVGGTVVVTHHPCENCVRFMRAAGIYSYVTYASNGAYIRVLL